MKELFGQLFVEAAEKSSTDLRFNWAEKISFKLTPSIIDGCVKALSEESNVYVYKKPDKQFSIYRYKESATLSLASEDKEFILSLGLSEVLGLQNLLIKAKERIYGW